MQALTPEGKNTVDAAAKRQGFSAEAGRALLAALVAGGGSQAQFNHAELGGMGQWSKGGMIMIGDMFNTDLKHRVDTLCTDLAELLQTNPELAPASRAPKMGAPATAKSPGRWPQKLGQPGSTGSQNDMHYAIFPQTRRLALEQGGQVAIYDTGDHAITGISQAQAGGQEITFTSQHGAVRLDELARVDP
jgi:hypothetical protein